MRIDNSNSYDDMVRGRSVSCLCDGAVQASAFGADSGIFCGIACIAFFTRPVFTKIFKIGSAKTNVEGLIGRKAKVVSEIDNNRQTGCAVVGGQEWTARAEDDAEIIPADAMVEIVNISGVKLIVKRLRESEEKTL